MIGWRAATSRKRAAATGVESRNESSQNRMAAGYSSAGAGV
jgi:hypothetical protein